MDGQPHFIQDGSFEVELTNRESHIHPIFREYKEVVYNCLEEDTQGTSYAASLKPYQLTKDVREDFQAIIS